MSNAPITPPPSPAVGPNPPAVDYETLPPTGVRKVLDAFEERDVQRIRWSSVFAGLFLAVGTQILLGLLGLAIGLSAVDPRAPNPIANLGSATGLWMGIVSLIALFVGGFAAAKLGGVIRRADGVLSGVLTWAASMVFTLLLLGTSLSAALSMPGLASSAADTATSGGIIIRTPEGRIRMQPMEQPVQIAPDAATAARSAWYAFGGVGLAFIAAVIGGAFGAVGTVSGPHKRAHDPVTRQRQIHERLIELEREREVLRREEDHIKQAG